MKTLCILLVAVVALVFSSESSLREVREFEVFEKDYSRIYRTHQERLKRMKVFINNLQDVEAHNSDPTRTYEKGINQFSDLTDEEFEKLVLSYEKPTQSRSIKSSKSYKGPSSGDISDLPTHVDWREKGVLTKCKDQGRCGSCWAFSTIEQIETYAKIDNGSLPILSAQHVTSCTNNAYNCGGTGGCKGATNSVGYDYARIYGVSMEADYPYVSGESSESEDCIFDPKNTGKLAKIRGYETLPSNDMYSVMKHLAEVGPLGVGVAASTFKSYKSGILSGCRFENNIVINHGIQLVGYGTEEKSGDYWIIRNSWGCDWGEEGFMKLRRYSDTRCGINLNPEFGRACKNDGVESQVVCGNCGILFSTDYPIGASCQ